MPLALPLSLRLLRHLRRAGACSGALLVGLLVLASMLGVLHAVAHPPEPLVQAIRLSADRAAFASASDKVGAAPAAAAQGTAASWLSRLFDHKANDRDCLIFDQLCHGPAAPAMALLALSFSLPVATALVTLQGAVIARWLALFDARGPPQRA